MCSKIMFVSMVVSIKLGKSLREALNWIGNEQRRRQFSLKLLLKLWNWTATNYFIRNFRTENKSCAKLDVGEHNCQRFPRRIAIIQLNWSFQVNHSSENLETAHPLSLSLKFNFISIAIETVRGGSFKFEQKNIN